MCLGCLLVCRSGANIEGGKRLSAVSLVAVDNPGYSVGEGQGHGSASPQALYEMADPDYDTADTTIKQPQFDGNYQVQNVGADLPTYEDVQGGGAGGYYANVGGSRCQYD